ncbi:MAG: DUF3078 domain-containing protein [Psychroflexus salarius]
MKQNFIFLSLTVLSLISFSVSAQAQTPKDSTWTSGGNFSLLINQSAFNAEWQGGGTSNYSANIIVNYNLNYKKGNYTWDTKFLGDFGINKTKDQDFYRKTSDRLEINSVVGRQINESKWYASALLNFRTQFDKGYSFSEDPNTGEELRTTQTEFLSPAYTQLGLGFLWKESENLKVNFSPVTGRIITANKKFTTTPGYQDGDFFGIDQNDWIRTEFGASVNTYGKFNLMEDITMENILNLYSNYIEDPQNIDIDYTMNIVMSVNKYISTNFTFQAIYDDNAVNGFQIREVLGVGVNFRL